MRRRVACLALLTALAFLGSGQADPKALDTSSGWTVSVPIGIEQTAWIGYFDFVATGTKPVRMTKARILGVPPGLELVGVYSASSINGRFGAARDMRETYGDFSLGPVSRVVVDPRSDREPWYLLAEFKARRVGTFETTGIAIDYEVGGRRGTARYDQRARIEVRRDRQPSMQPAGPTPTS